MAHQEQYYFMPGTSQWSVLEIQPGSSVKFTVKDKGWNSPPRPEGVGGVVSTLITQLKIDYPNVYLPSLSDSPIFPAHYLLWILSIQAIKVARSSYKTPQSVRRMLPWSLRSENRTTA